MARLDSFRMKVDESERRMIAILAERLQRSQSDAVRLVVREALRALDADQVRQVHQAQEDCPCQN
jgi:hypothetical protein